MAHNNYDCVEPWILTDRLVIGISPLPEKEAYFVKSDDLTKFNKPYMGTNYPLDLSMITVILLHFFLYCAPSVPKSKVEMEHSYIMSDRQKSDVPYGSTYYRKKGYNNIGRGSFSLIR